MKVRIVVILFSIGVFGHSISALAAPSSKKNAMDPVEKSVINVYSSYNQIHLEDSIWLRDPKLRAQVPEPRFTDQTMMDKVQALNGYVVFQPVRNGKHPITFEFFRSEPGLDEAKWDHIVDCSMECKSSEILISSCDYSVSEYHSLAIKPGSYRLRILFGGLSTVDDDQDTGRDHYAVQIWPGAPIKTKVVKMYRYPFYDKLKQK